MIEKPSAVIVAAGQGTRLGTPAPKAFIMLGKIPLFLHSLKIFDDHPAISHIVLVVSADMSDRARDLIDEAGVGTSVSIVVGAGRRWESVRNGVNSTPEHTQWVCVHDAARPFVTPAVIDTVLDMAERYRAVVTVTEVADTIRRFEGDRAGKTIDRSKLVRVGTPQLFHKQTLLSGFELACTMSAPPTDEAVLMERMGIEVGIAWGDPLNFKITTPQDLEMAEAIIEKRG